MIAIDANLLVYAHRSAAPEHAAARRAIERAAGTGAWGFAQASLPEFWAVVTHPDSSGRPSSGKEAAGFLKALVDAGAVVFGPGPGFGERLLEVARALNVRGPRVFDLQIALMAFDHGCTEIWTRDRGFVAPPGVSVVDPLQT